MPQASDLLTSCLGKKNMLQVADLLNSYLSNFRVSQCFTQEDVVHW
jgi:hypothetical protein